jgi:hypothetical protein
MINRTNDFSSVNGLQKASSLQKLNDRGSLTGNRFRENLGTLKNRASRSSEVNKDEFNTYRFELKRRVNLEVSIDNREDSGFFDFLGTKKRVQATLFNSGGSKLKATDQVRPDDDDDFSIRLQPGTYSVRVTGRSENDVAYKLELSAENA